MASSGDQNASTTDVYACIGSCQTEKTKNRPADCSERSINKVHSARYLCALRYQPVHVRRRLQIDADRSGEISLWELFETLEMKQSKFTKRIFRYALGIDTDTCFAMVHSPKTGHLACRENSGVHVLLIADEKSSILEKRKTACGLSLKALIIEQNQTKSWFDEGRRQAYPTSPCSHLACQRAYREIYYFAAPPTTTYYVSCDVRRLG